MRRTAAKVDANQREIVKKLRAIPGVRVSLNHDDLLVGRNIPGEGPRTFWFEVKDPSQLRSDGTLRKGALKPSQIKLREEWTGHYQVVTSFEEICETIGVKLT